MSGPVWVALNNDRQVYHRRPDCRALRCAAEVQRRTLERKPAGQRQGDRGPGRQLRPCRLCGEES